ncbi:MAG: hypothetical protein QXI60_03340 [Thermofilaceae archaeon]
MRDWKDTLQDAFARLADFIAANLISPLKDYLVTLGDFFDRIANALLLVAERLGELTRDFVRLVANFTELVAEAVVRGFWWWADEVMDLVEDWLDRHFWD